MSNIISLAEKLSIKYAKTPQFIYHIKSKNFKGDKILPLSALEEKYPKIYKKEISKYKGRESHPQTKIKLLDCKWKDCVNFSTIDPRKIFQMEELLGIPGYKNSIDVEIFKFNIKDIKNLDFVLYNDNKNPKKDDAYKKINVSSYEETSYVPLETAKYFIECKEKNEYPLIFGNVPHILVKGEVPIDNAEVLKFEATLKQVKL